MQFENMLGKTLLSIEIQEESVNFNATDQTFNSCHYCDCCESVRVYDTKGNIEDVIGSPLLEVTEESIKNEDPQDIKTYDQWRDSWTWTTQTLRTTKGSFTIRWFGKSNGYYTEVPYFGIGHRSIGLAENLSQVKTQPSNIIPGATGVIN